MLTGPQLSRITDALLAAYSRDELRQVMLACMDVDFTHPVSPDKPYAAQVFEFVEWANREGRALELTRCAAAGKERNAQLQQLWAETQRWQAAESQPLPPHLRPERGGQRLHSLSAEERSRMEAAYLDGLLADYAVWKEKYTPLTGVAAIKTGEEPLSLGLPDWFMPTGFEKLEEHGQGADRRVERIPVSDLREAVAQYRRLVVLGEPGAGKTTTLWRLVYDYAAAARRPHGRGFAGWLRRLFAAPGDGGDMQGVPLPVFVPLGGYSGPESALEYAARFAGPLAPFLADYLEEGRVILLLDGMNEMPRSGYGERVKRIQRLLDSFPAAPVIVTCRVLDYVEELKLEKLTVNELDPARQREFLHRYLGAADGEKLFWQLAGEPLAEVWGAWRKHGRTFEALWTGEDLPDEIRWSLTASQRSAYDELRRRELPPLMALAVNPFLLVMFAQVYAGQGALPQNRGRLFAAFVDTLLERERKRREADGWPGAATVIDALAELAYAMQEAGERGTAVERAWAAERVPNTDETLYLAASATLIDASGGVRFVHQLLQEYFAAVAWRRRFEAGDDMAHYWPGGWLEQSGWEETAILLAGILPDMTAFVEKLTPVNPPLAARCIAESGGVEPAAETNEEVQTVLIAYATSMTAPVKERNMTGNALNFLGDPRPGVGLRADGLPNIVWCKVPAGEFLMGSIQEAGGTAPDNEMPQHRITLPVFCIAKYPITNAQYQAFVDDGGYTEKWRQCWTQTGWKWRTKGNYTGPYRSGGDFDLSNHPVVGVSWYEAVAFCNWLSERSGCLVRLPSEAEWEKAARGTDGQRYPWGKDITKNHANYGAAGIRSTSAVGVFPKGASPYQLLDASGNVWEWTISLWGEYRHEPKFNYPYNTQDGRENIDAPETVLRTLRGGSWLDLDDRMHCAWRVSNYPRIKYYGVGFRVVSPGC